MESLPFSVASNWLDDWRAKQKQTIVFGIHRIFRWIFRTVVLIV